MKIARFQKLKVDGVATTLPPAWFTSQGFPVPVTEFKFKEGRRWAFDYCWPDLKIAFECEGGKWKIGRHQRPQGFENDCFKYSWAAILGWKVIRATTDMIRTGEASVLISEALRAKSPPPCNP